MRLKSILIIVLYGILSICIFVLFKTYFQLIDHVILRLGIAGVIISLLLYALVAFTPLPTEPLSIMIIALYSPAVTLFIITLGNTIVAMIEYWIGLHLSKISDYERKLSKLPFGLSKLPLSSVKVLIIGRLISGYGNKFLSLLAGTQRIQLRTFAWTTAVTNLLGAILMTVGGHSLKTIVDLLVAWLKL